MVHLRDKNDWIQFEVITETGLCLGWVRSVSVDAEDNTLISLVVVPNSIRWLPEKLVGVYKLASVDLICIGSERLIVAEGSEEKLNHLKIGVLERLGITKLPWMREKESYITLSTDLRKDDDDDDAGFQPAIKPRRPNPKPTDDDAEIPLE